VTAATRQARGDYSASVTRSFAFVLTASSNVVGTRMLISAAYFSNSNRIGLNPDRSYSDRSASSTNRSASASVLKTGMVLSAFSLHKVVDFFLVHVPGRYRAKRHPSQSFPDREGDEQASASRVANYGVVSQFAVFSSPIRPNHGFMIQHMLDFRLGNPMFRAFWPVAVVPVKTR
jgi:hypothetical protein